MMPNGVICLFFLLHLSWCQLQHSNTVKECPVLGHLVIIRSTLPSVYFLASSFVLPPQHRMLWVLYPSIQGETMMTKLFHHFEIPKPMDAVRGHRVERGGGGHGGVGYIKVKVHSV